MTSLINAKVRFALDPTGGIYDYLTNKTHNAVGVLRDWPVGHWDLAHVKRLLLAGEPVEAAHYRHPADPGSEAPKPLASKNLTVHDLPAPETTPVEEETSTAEGETKGAEGETQGGTGEQTQHGEAQGAS